MNVGRAVRNEVLYVLANRPPVSVLVMKAAYRYFA